MLIKSAIKEFIEYQGIKQRRSPSTIKNYGRYLTEFAAFTENIPVESITVDHTDRFQEHLAIRKSIVTQSYYLIAIRVLLKWLILKKNLSVLVPEKIELPKITKKMGDCLTLAEVDRIRAVLRADKKRHLKPRAALEVMFASGIRVAELIGLQLKDINFDNGEIRVLGKGDKQRVAFLNADAIFYLKKYLNRFDIKGGYLFPITTRQVQRLIERYAKKAGIEKSVTPHSFRHAFATGMLNRGADLRVVQEFLGHNSIVTTQLYTHVTNGRLRKFYQQYSSSGRKDKTLDQRIITLENKMDQIISLLTRR